MAEITEQITLYTGVVPDKDTQTPATFNDAADSFVAQMEAWPAEYNTFGSQANSLRTDVNTYRSDALTAKTAAETARTHANNWATAAEETQINDGVNPVGFSAYHWAQKTAKGERLTATSSTSVTIGTGSKTFTLAESYRAFTTGSKVRIVDGTNPATNYMEGMVTSYNSTTDELIVSVAVVGGSGTSSNWYISLNHGGDASTVNGLNASSIATAGYLYPLNANKKFPTDVLEIHEVYTNRDNITLNAFHIAELHGFSVQKMIDGVTDTYTDDSGIDKTKSSENIAVINGSLQTIPPWDIAIATYANKSFSVAGQETTPTGVFFKPDGTVMYVIGYTNNTVYQYTLSTAWDIATATYANKSFSVAGQETYPTGVFFKPDGTVMYVIGYNTDTVYQYTLSTAWDISTATYASKSFSVAGQETTPTGVFFKPDGTVMYVIGYNTDTVYQYTLSTPWNYTAISTVIAALSQPNSGYIVLQEEDIDVITLNTNLQAFVSRDGGTTFTQATLAEIADLGTQRILTATVDLTAQPAGTSMVYKLVASGDKKLLVHATSLQWN